MRKPFGGSCQGFLLASALLIGVPVVASGFGAGHLLERQVLTNEEEQTAKVVQAEARRHLASDFDFVLPHPLMKRGIFEAFYRELPGVFRVKALDRTGRTVWSDEQRLIGMVFPDNSYVAKALKGQVVTVLEAPKRSEHVYEQTKGHVIETYVPITLPGTPGIVGVIETYKDVTEVIRAIRRTQRGIWVVAGSAGLSLYVALALYFWRATANEQRAMIRLDEMEQRLKRSAAWLEESNVALLAKTEEVERAKQEVQARLVEERLAAVNQVVVGLHHSILNPLAGILGTLRVLAQDGITQATRVEALAEAEAEIRKIENLIRRLLQLHRTVATCYVGDITMLDLERSCKEDQPV
jgi:signal transduction histidine kinase